MTPAFHITVLVSAVLVATFIIAPMTAPALVPGAIGLLVLWHVARKRALPFSGWSWLFIISLVTGLFLLANSFWSLSPASARAAVALYFVLVFGSLATVVALREQTTGAVFAISLGICIGVSVGTAFLSFELLTAQTIRRTIMSFLPAVRAKVPEMQVADDWVTAMPGYLLNRNAAALALCLWPTLLMTKNSFPGCKPLFWGIAALAVMTVMASDHETSKLALAGSAVAFAISRFSLPAARALMIAAWTAATMLVVPLSTLAYSQQMYQSAWLPETARHRVVIWSYVAGEVARAPVLGVGMNSTRPLSAKALHAAEAAPHSKFLRITTSHSHNIYLQAWYETGAVGAAMLFTLGLLLLGSLKSLADAVQPYAHATFATAALVAGSSFSLWAMWLMAAFALAALLAAVGTILTERYEKAAAGAWPPLTLSEEGSTT